MRRFFYVESEEDVAEHGDLVHMSCQHFVRTRPWAGRLEVVDTRDSASTQIRMGLVYQGGHNEVARGELLGILEFLSSFAREHQITFAVGLEDEEVDIVSGLETTVTEIVDFLIEE